MEAEPSIWIRLYDFGWSLLPYWWILAPGGIFALEPMMESFLKEGVLTRLNQSWPKTTRRRHFRVASIVAMFLSCFLAFDDLGTKYRATQKALNSVTGERDDARRYGGASPAQQATIDRLSRDLVSARGQIDVQAKTIEGQANEIAVLNKQREELRTPRHLSEKEKQALISAFAPLAAEFTELAISAPGDGEAQAYAKEFAATFNQIGIRVGRIGFIIPTSAGSEGVQIVVRNANNPPAKAIKFQQAMLSAGIKAIGGTMDTLSDDAFVFVVATKPVP
jgi:hypothetical protein